MNKQHIELDISKYGNGKCIRVAQGDVGGTTIEAAIFDNGSKLSLDGAKVQLVALLPNKRNYYRDDCQCSGNLATHVLKEDKLCSVPGYTDDVYFTVEIGGKVYSTERFALEIVRSALDGRLPAESWDNHVQDLIDRGTAAAESAERSAGLANAASDKANAAALKASEMAGNAGSAADKANSAAESASEAALSANGAAASAKQAAIGANEAANNASDASRQALEAAKEAIGSISPEKKIYLTYEDAGDVTYLTLVDAEEQNA